MAACPEEPTKKVEEWLAKVLRGNVPHHEASERALSALRELKDINCAEDARAMQKIEAYKKEAEIYAEEARKLSAIWSAGGIAPSQLPTAVRRRLRILGDVAAALDVENGSITRCAQRLSELQLRKSDLQTKIDSEKEQLRQVRQLTGAMERKLQNAMEDVAAEHRKTKEKQRQLKKDMRFLKLKRQQYKEKMRRMGVKKIDPMYTHEEVVACSQRLEDLQKTEEMLKAELKPYRDLIPNEEVIASKLKDAKTQLQALEKELQRRLNEGSKSK